jgi:hypothetical protein
MLVVPFLLTGAEMINEKKILNVIKYILLMFYLIIENFPIFTLSVKLDLM